MKGRPASGRLTTSRRDPMELGTIPSTSARHVQMREILSAFGLPFGGLVSGVARGGDFVAEPTGQEMLTFDPTSGDVLARVMTAGPDDYLAVSSATHSAFERWRTVPAPRRGEVVRRLGDRKSTRLNSSHANISYAVFC